LVGQRDNVVYWKTKRKIKNDLQSNRAVLEISLVKTRWRKNFQKVIRKTAGVKIKMDVEIKNGILK